jgi:hypothetical protein
MNKFLKPVIKLVPTFQYLNIFWNLNTEVDTCVQFKYLSTRPCNYTYYIVHSTDYVLSLRKYYNLFVYLFVSWSGNITTSLMVPLDVLCLWCWVYLIHFLCCFTQSNDILYIWLTPPIFGCLNVCIFYFAILVIDYKVPLLRSNWYLPYALQTNYLHAFFSHLSLHLIEI